MPTVQELIESNKNLLKNFPNARTSKKPRSQVGNDVFIYQDRPVTNTDWRKDRDVTFVSVYLPTQIPSFDGVKSIVLHKHTVFEPCERSRFCHVVGYNVPEIYFTDFYIVWGYLYYPEATPIVSVRLDLEM